MNIAELKTQIKSNELDNVYIFIGEEIYIRNVYIDNIADLGYLKQEMPTVADVFKKLGANKLINKPVLYVIRDDTDFIKQDIVVWQRLEALCTSGACKVILVYNTLDKRSKFYKHYGDTIVNFEKLSEPILIKYIQKDSDLDTAQAKDLIKRCSSNYTLCLLELDKLKMLAQVNNTTISKIYNKAVNDGVLIALPTAELQLYINAVLERDFAKAIEISKMLDEKTDPPLKVLAFLYNTFEALFSVVAYESGYSFKKNESGVNFWAVKNAEIFSFKWQIAEVRGVMDYIQSVESGIKMGIVFAETAMDNLAVLFMTIQLGLEIRNSK